MEETDATTTFFFGQLNMIKFPDFSLIWNTFLKFPAFSLTGKLETNFPGFPGFPGWLQGYPV